MCFLETPISMVASGEVDEQEESCCCASECKKYREKKTRKMKKERTIKKEGYQAYAYVDGYILSFPLSLHVIGPANTYPT